MLSYRDQRKTPLYDQFESARRLKYLRSRVFLDHLFGEGDGAGRQRAFQRLFLAFDEGDTAAALCLLTVLFSHYNS